MPSSASAIAVPAVATSSKPSSSSARATGSTADLVAVAHAEERAPPVGSRAPAARSAFANAVGEVAGARHHLAGRAHLGPEHRVGAGEARERQHGRLHVVSRRGGDSGGRPSSAMRAPAASRHAASTRLTPVAFDANGTVRDARGFTSST